MSQTSNRVEAKDDPRGWVAPPENVVAVVCSLVEAGFHISPWHVFENGEKRPAIDPTTGRSFEWGQGSFTDPHEVADLWLGTYYDCWAGINVGKSGLLVVDLDQHDDKDGEKALHEAKLPLPPTTKFRSRRNGWHHYYRAPEGVKLKDSLSDLKYTDEEGVTRRLNGVDVKAGNGLVIYYNGVLTPDRRASLTFAPAPKWACVVDDRDGGDRTPVEWAEWTAACRPGAPTPEDVAYMRDHFKVTGTGHDEARDAVYHLVSRANDGLPGIPLLLETAQMLYLAHPWEGYGKDWREMVRGAIAEFGIPLPFVTGVRAEQHEAREEWVERAAANGGVVGDDGAVTFPEHVEPEVVAEVLAAEPPKPPVQATVDEERERKVLDEAHRIVMHREAMRLADILETPADVSLAAFDEWMTTVEPKQALVDDLVYEDSLVLWAATGGSGKTAAMCGIVMAMGNDFDFVGHEVRPGRVLLCEGEGLRDLPKRMWAWANYMGVEKPRFDHITKGPSEGLNLGTLKALRERHREAKWDLIVFDTFSALFTVESENDNAEVSKILRELRGFIADVPGTTVIVMHHTTNGSDTKGNKTFKARGASAFRDNADTVVVMHGKRDDLMISTDPEHNGKQRDANPVTWDGFGIRIVEVPQAGFGQTGPVISQTPGSTPVQRAANRLHQAITCFMSVNEELRTSEWESRYVAETGLSDYSFKEQVKKAVEGGLVERPAAAARTAPYHLTERGKAYWEDPDGSYEDAND